MIDFLYILFIKNIMTLDKNTSRARHQTRTLQNNKAIKARQAALKKAKDAHISKMRKIQKERIAAHKRHIEAQRNIYKQREAVQRANNKKRKEQREKNIQSERKSLADLRSKASHNDIQKRKQLEARRQKVRERDKAILLANEKKRQKIRERDLHKKWWKIQDIAKNKITKVPAWSITSVSPIVSKVINNQILWSNPYLEKLYMYFPDLDRWKMQSIINKYQNQWRLSLDQQFLIGDEIINTTEVWKTVVWKKIFRPLMQTLFTSMSSWYREPNLETFLAGIKTTSDTDWNLFLKAMNPRESDSKIANFKLRLEQIKRCQTTDELKRLPEFKKFLDLYKVTSLKGNRVSMTINRNSEVHTTPPLQMQPAEWRLQRRPVQPQPRRQLQVAQRPSVQNNASEVLSQKNKQFIIKLEEVKWVPWVPPTTQRHISTFIKDIESSAQWTVNDAILRKNYFQIFMSLRSLAWNPIINTMLEKLDPNISDTQIDEINKALGIWNINLPFVWNPMHKLVNRFILETKKKL